MDNQSKIILISGPTASGKSSLAVKIAKKVNGEIINADSMQVYKQLKILTARPNKKEQKNIRHHLYGVIDANKKFSTGQWLKLAIKTIKEIHKRKKIAILVGGTGLYFQSLISGLVKIPKIPFKFRFAIIVARRVYRQIGRKIIQKRNMETYQKSGKIYVNSFGKVFQTIFSLWDLIILFFIDIESHQRTNEYNIINEEINLDERL